MGLLGLPPSGQGRGGRRAELPGAGSPQSARPGNKGVFLGGACEGRPSERTAWPRHSLTLGPPKGACWSSWCLVGSAEASPRGTQPLSISHFVEFAPLSGGEMMKCRQRLVRRLEQHMANSKCTINTGEMNAFKGRREQKEGSKRPPPCYFSLCRCPHLSTLHTHLPQWLLKGLIHYVVNWLPYLYL